MPDNAVPVDENSLTELFPVFVIHELPNASNAIAEGEDKPPPDNGDPLTFPPLELSSVRVLFPKFVTQAWPVVSNAIADGLFKLPATYPHYRTEMLPCASVP